MPTYENFVPKVNGLLDDSIPEVTLWVIDYENRCKTRVIDPKGAVILGVSGEAPIGLGAGFTKWVVAPHYHGIFGGRVSQREVANMPEGFTKECNIIYGVSERIDLVRPMASMSVVSDVAHGTGFDVIDFTIGRLGIAVAIGMNVLSELKSEYGPEDFHIVTNGVWHKHMAALPEFRHDDDN